ncbi:hypothetical protein ACPV3A_16620 [Paenibacillus sp. Dod16]|uniref:hypothetical protein n=1 Tax=Paenibacillus sp. Dod16 TaxID=3416392 RepID=UPI003CEE1662
MKIQEFEKIAAELRVESLEKIQENFISVVAGLDKTAENFNEDLGKMIGAISLSVFNQNQQYTVELFKRVLEFEK